MKQKHYDKLSNDYYYVTHAAKGVPSVFTDALHDNLIFARKCIIQDNLPLAYRAAKLFVQFPSVAIMCYLFGKCQRMKLYRDQTPKRYKPIVNVFLVRGKIHRHTAWNRCKPTEKKRNKEIKQREQDN